MAEDLSFFIGKRNAIATNRGFYYQYLISLKKWVTNFIDEKNSELLVESGEDIKEEGNINAYSQIKSYSSNFSLQSAHLYPPRLQFRLLQPST